MRFSRRLDRSLRTPPAHGYGFTVQRLLFARAFKASTSLKLTGPFKIIAVGLSPASATPVDYLLVTTPIYQDFLNYGPGEEAHCRASVAHCKPCANLNNNDDISQHSRAGLSQYELRLHQLHHDVPARISHYRR